MPASLPRRLWCSCTIIDFLAGKVRAADCEKIWNQARNRELEIVVSTLAMGEVAKLEGQTDADAEAKIKQFFEERWVVPAAYDITTAEKVRDLVRRYGIKPIDAAHVATAIQHHIPLLETFDQEMIDKVNGKEGNPLVAIRNPRYDGPPPSPQQPLPLAESGPAAPSA